VDVPRTDWEDQCDVVVQLLVRYVAIHDGSLHAFSDPPSLVSPSAAPWPASRTVKVFSSEQCGEYAPFDAPDRHGAQFVQYVAHDDVRRVDSMRRPVYLPLFPIMHMPYTPATQAFGARASRRPYLFNLVISQNTNDERQQWVTNASDWARKHRGFVLVVRKWAAHGRRVRFASIKGKPNIGCRGRVIESDLPISYEHWRQVLLQSTFTLSPSGAAFECFRWFEAAETGSIPVVTEHDLRRAKRCSMVPFEGAPFLIVRSITDALPVMMRLARNPHELDARSRALRRWYDHFSADVAARSEKVLRASRSADQPESRMLPSKGLPANPKYTLLVQHFASTLRYPHEPEIEGAIRANLLQSALAEVWVWYSNGPGNGCNEFIARLEANRLWLAECERLALRCLTRLKCKERPRTSAPTYLELLEYASSQPDGAFAGSHVVLANADVVFDETIHHLSSLGFDGNRGYVLSITHHADPDLYALTIGLQEAAEAALDRSAVDLYCGQFLETSWDAFVFQTPLPSLSSFGIFFDVPQHRAGAESRTRCGLERAGLRLRNACMHVRLQSFHYSTKMHNQTRGVGHRYKVNRADLHDPVARCSPNNPLNEMARDSFFTHPCDLYDDSRGNRLPFVVDPSFCERHAKYCNQTLPQDARQECRYHHNPFPPPPPFLGDAAHAISADEDNDPSST
jgi:hypothetical protein